jgi:geranylgeranyl pyrophosphate synthase
VAAWPEIAALFEAKASAPRPDWEWPLIACQAVDGDLTAGRTGAAAIACLYISIILVDDMLDEDPRGEHLRRGVGPTANMAFALQAAAFRLVDRAPVSATQRAAVADSLAWAALETARGQHLDFQSLAAEGQEGEESYWEVVRTKSTPFYGTALHVGALLGDAEPQAAESLRDLGLLFGEVIQIQDDLLDAFQVPANPDWTQQRPNLAILYGRTADHPDRGLLRQLADELGHHATHGASPCADDERRLRQAQRILIDCGAVSYCAYHLIARHREARRMLAGLPVPKPQPIARLVAQQTQPLIQILQSRGIDVPADLSEPEL